MIDRKKGLVSKSAGPWAQDNPMSYGDYIIAGESNKQYVLDSLEFYKTIGVDQIDYHQGAGTFRQGDFMYYRYDDHEGFKKNVSDVLEANGMQAGIHTYVYYIHPGCTQYLSDPKWQKQLDYNEIFTLKEDISEDADFVIFNTCTVRDNANQRVYGRLGQLGHQKKKNPDISQRVTIP